MYLRFDIKLTLTDTEAAEYIKIWIKSVCTQPQYIILSLKKHCELDVCEFKQIFQLVLFLIYNIYPINNNDLKYPSYRICDA